MDDMQPPSDSSDLQEKFRWLHRQIQILLVLVILVSGTLTLFLLRQYRETNTALQSNRQIVAQFTTNLAPAMDDFLKRVVEYSHTHADLAQALIKYGINPNAPMPAPATPTPAPAKK